MSDVDEFISKFNQDEKMLLSWGKLVCQTITDELKKLIKIAYSKLSHASE